MTVAAQTPALNTREPKVPPTTSSTIDGNQRAAQAGSFLLNYSPFARTTLAFKKEIRPDCDPAEASSGLPHDYFLHAFEAISAETGKPGGPSPEIPTSATHLHQASIGYVIVQAAYTGVYERCVRHPDRLELRRRTERVFQAGKEEVFEDGVSTGFSQDLTALIARFGTASVEELSRMLLNHEVGSEVASEALRWVGRIRQPSSRQARLKLLQDCLQSSSPLVRDGALLGLSALRDPRAITSLEEAVQREKIAELRKDMERALSRLRSLA